MQTIGSFEAKTKLSALLDRVDKGESFMITRRGVPIATLTKPADEIFSGTEEAIAGLLNLRRTLAAKKTSGFGDVVETLRTSREKREERII